MKAQDLKNSILQLAVQGKLVPQDPADEPASVLLERIREERAKLIREKKIKAPKGGESVIYRDGGSWFERRGDAAPKCIDDEIPFEIPETWAWARLDSFAVLERGSGIKRTDTVEEGMPCVRYGELYTTYDDAIVCAETFIPESYYRDCHKIAPDEVVLTLTGENNIDIGRAVVNATGAELAFGGDLLGVKEHGCYGAFLAALLRSEYVRVQRTAAATGNIIVHLGMGKIASFLVALPPLAEQQRIVARIDELMPLVEEYGKLEDAREALDAELPEQLRKSILQMAVQGKLVPQDPADEPAGVLLERIRKERAKLIREKKIKAPKGGESVIYRDGDSWYERRGDAAPKCIDDEIPFEIPDIWTWARVEQLAEYVNGCAFKPEDWSDEGQRIVRIQNLTDLQAPYNRTTRSVDSKYDLRDGNVLVSWSATLAAFLWERGDAILNQHIFKCNLFGGLDKQYYINTMNVLLASNKEEAHGSTMRHLTAGVFGSILFPLPPFAEQKRIAERVNVLNRIIIRGNDDCNK